MLLSTISITVTVLMHCGAALVFYLLLLYKYYSLFVYDWLPSHFKSDHFDMITMLQDIL